ncbi:MAG: hypothetical protein WBP81_06260 [Solirubrobacteraceae bacterium]
MTRTFTVQEVYAPPLLQLAPAVVPAGQAAAVAADRELPTNHKA